MQQEPQPVGLAASLDRTSAQHPDQVVDGDPANGQQQHGRPNGLQSWIAAGESENQQEGNPEDGGNPSAIHGGSIYKYNGASPMKAYVYVSLKKTVLDPQGKTIHGALKKMGYRGIDDLRQGKYFEIALDSSMSREEAQAEIERIAREVLTNPVIEEYRFTIEG
jgi:phosphoribosylformylglycinamidine synthase subunit PurS